MEMKKKRAARMSKNCTVRTHFFCQGSGRADAAGRGARRLAWMAGTVRRSTARFPAGSPAGNMIGKTRIKNQDKNREKRIA